MHGQMTLFDYIGPEKEEPAEQEQEIKECHVEVIQGKPIRQPCGRPCSVECFSKICYIMRGWIWHSEGRHNWLRDENGELVKGPKQCDWEPEEHT